MVGLVNLVLINGAAEGSGGAGIGGEEEDARGGAVETMNGVDLLADLITEDFHGDEVIGFRIVGWMNQLASGLIDCDEGVVLVENGEHLKIRGIWRWPAGELRRY